MAPELPADTGDLLMQKLGPLPTWGWGVVILGAAYGYRMYAKKKTGAAVPVATSAGYTSANLPSNIQPQYTTVNEDTYSNIGNTNSGNLTTIGRQINVPGSPPVTPPPTSPAAPPPPVAPPPPAGKWLTVVKWNPAQRNAPSTLTGLALQAYGNPSMWPKIWNAPQNAALVAQRGDPTRIQPGDRFFAPV